MGTSLTATGVQFPDNSVQTAPALTGFRNRIINGDMRIAQRGAVAFSNGGAVYGGCDRTIVGAGFTTSFTGNVRRAGSAANGYYVQELFFSSSGSGEISFTQCIEANNVYDLQNTYITVQMKVYHDTGQTIPFKIRMQKPGSVDNWSSATEFAISSENLLPSGVMTLVTFTTYLGALDARNGLRVIGTYYVPSGTNTNRYLQITNIQLEKGSTATDFEFRPYSVELAMCQRYYEKSYVDGVAPGSVTATGMWSSQAYSAAYYYAPYVYFKVTKRTTPSIVIYSVNNGAAGNMYAWSTGVNFVPASVYGSGIGTQGIQFYAGSGLTAGVEYACHWTASAEL